MDFFSLPKGFTLIELVVILFIMGIIATGTYISWRGTTINLGAQAQQLANDIRFTQSLAMNKGQRFYLIKTASSTYQIRNSAGTAIRLSSGSTTATLNTGITFGTMTNLPNSLIAFDGSGKPYTDTSSPGTALSSTATMPLTAGSETQTISITPTTGRLVVQ